MEKQEYIDIFVESLNTIGKTPNCRFCGSQEYAALDVRGMLLLDEQGKENTRVSVPTGVIVCKKCGHIDLFALGYLKPSLMPKKGEVAPKDSSDIIPNQEETVEQI